MPDLQLALPQLIVDLAPAAVEERSSSSSPRGFVVSQVLPVNPAAAVRGPKHVVTKGATRVLSPAEARRLLEAIDTGTLAGRRDRALVSVMLYQLRG